MDLREAAQMALDALDKLLDKLNADICDNSGIWDEYCDGGNAMQALRAALAQPEQEPQETVAKWIKANTEHKQWYICPKCSHQTPRWKDEWVGLTDEEREAIDKWIEFKEAGGNEPVPAQKLVTYVESKLREKNA